MKQVRIGRPVIIGEMTIIPVEEVSAYKYSRKDGFWIYISKGPIGVVIDLPRGKWALDIRRGQVPLKTYIQEFEGLQQALNNL